MSEQEGCWPAPRAGATCRALEVVWGFPSTKAEPLPGAPPATCSRLPRALSTGGFLVSRGLGALSRCSCPS